MQSYWKLMYVVHISSHSALNSLSKICNKIKGRVHGKYHQRCSVSLDYGKDLIKFQAFAVL
jgi:hypothetical protein